MTQVNAQGKKKQEGEDDGRSPDEEDMEIHFNKITLLEHLAHLEEDNLFKIHLV